MNSPAQVALGYAAAKDVLARMTIITSRADQSTLLARLATPDRPIVVSFVNQHALNLLWTAPDFGRLLASSDWLLRDGVGLEICLRALGQPAGLNMNGTDLIPRIASAYAGRRIALFGSKPPWTARAADALRAKGCNVVGVLDGFRPAEDYVLEVQRQRPELVILAMGMPRQEQVAIAIVAAVDAPIVVVNGGAIADFLASRFPRSPGWMRVARLEWAFRLACEPRRLFRRYGPGGAAFAWRVVRLCLAQRGTAPGHFADDVSLPRSTRVP